MRHGVSHKSQSLCDTEIVLLAHGHLKRLHEVRTWLRVQAVDAQCHGRAQVWPDPTVAGLGRVDDGGPGGRR